MVTAIIVAAGKGVRMNADVRKQYLLLCGEPILLRTLRVFDGCPGIEEIRLVVPPQDVDECRRMVNGCTGITSPCHVIPGGDSRQESVFNALLSLEADAAPDDLVAIHDGVRPLVSVDQIVACVSSAKKSGAGILAIPVSDTVKQVGDDGCISGTLERSGLWLAQTPQVFRYGIIMEAHGSARRDGIVVTDDAMLLERSHVRVKIVPGNRNNIKITTPEDLALGEFLLNHKL